MTRAILCLLSALAVQSAAAAPATLPATQPASLSPEIQKLIGDLGAEDFQTREAATEQLRKIGRAGLPALKEAAKSDDPEVRARAESIIARLDRPEPDPADPRGGPNQGWRVRPMPGGAFGNRITIRSSNNNGEKTTNVEENDRKIHISDGRDGIVVSVTEQREGKEVTDEYKAASAEELKKNHPEAHALYQRYAGGGGMIHIGIGGGMVRPMVPGPMPPDAMQRLQEAQKQLQEMMRDRELAPNIQERMQQRLRDLERRLAPPDAKDAPQPGPENKERIKPGPEAWRDAMPPDVAAQLRDLAAMRAQLEAAVAEQMEQMRALQEQMRKELREDR